MGVELITTEDALMDVKIVKRLGLVRGVSVYSRGAIGTFFGNIASWGSGKQKGYTKAVKENQNLAIQEMIEEANALGANAIIGVRLVINEFMTNDNTPMSEVVAYGTAVIIG